MARSIHVIAAIRDMTAQRIAERERLQQLEQIRLQPEQIVHYEWISVQSRLTVHYT